MRRQRGLYAPLTVTLSTLSRLRLSARLLARAGLRGPGSPSSRNLARVGHAFDQRARPLPWPSASGPGSEPRAPGPGPRPRAPAPGRASLGPGPGPRALGLALRRAPSGPPAGSFWPPGVWPSGGLLVALRRAPPGPQAPPEFHRFPKLFGLLYGFLKFFPRFCEKYFKNRKIFYSHKKL